MRCLCVVLVMALIAMPLAAAELGHCTGSVTIDKQKIDLGYAYAVGHQRNEISKRKDDVKVVMTDKPLADDVNLGEIDYNFPEGVNGIVVSIASSQKAVTHIIVQHPRGTFDGGFFEENPDYRFKTANGSHGTIAGRASSARVTTNTMTFYFDVDFNALVK